MLGTDRISVGKKRGGRKRKIDPFADVNRKNEPEEVSFTMNALNLLKAVLVFIAMFHLVFGLGLMLSVDFQKTAVAAYGGALEWSPANIYFIRVIGSFAFVLGYLAWMAFRDPVRYRVIIIGFIGFFMLRNISRHLFAGEVYSALNISETMNAFTSVFFGLQALLLAYLLWRSSKGSQQAK